MASPDRILQLKLLADVASLQKDMAKVTKSVDGAGGALKALDAKMKKMTDRGGVTGSILGGVGLGAGLGVFGAIEKGIGIVVDGIGDSIKAASDQEEALSKVTVVFGDQGRVIERWARTAADSMGMSETAALSAAGTLGNLFDGLGIANDAGLEMSKTITQLAADLGSFNNVATDEALTALQSGLLGEAEPMRRFGSALSAARVEAYGFANGLFEVVRSGSTTKRVMSEAQKVQARYALILEDTTNAQGDFARTSDGMANSQKTLTAKFEDFQVKLGQLLQGPAAGVVGFFDQLIDRLAPSGAGSLPPRIQGLIDQFEKLDKVAGSMGSSGSKVKMTLEDAAAALSSASEIQRLGGNFAAAKWLDMLGPQFIQIADGAGVTVDQFVALAFEASKAGHSFEVFRSSAIAAVNGTLNATTTAVASWQLGMKYMGDGAQEAGATIYGGLVPKVKGAFGAMFATMESQKEPWRTAWKEMAAYAKDPFRPDAFQRWLGERADKAVERAKQAAANGKPGVAKRWLALARVMKTPVLAALAETEDEINALVAAMRTVILLGRRTGTTRMGSNEKVAGRATGGPVTAGRPYIVGENRPELFVPSTSGTIHSSVGGMGGNTYVININATAGTDRAALGREVVDLIRAYERRDGKVWRTA